MSERAKERSIRDRISELEVGLQIDKNDLDRCVEEHAELFYRVSKLLEYRISDRDAAKQELSEIEAKVDAKVRRDAKISGERVTEAEVKAMTITDAGVKQAMSLMHKVSLDVGLLKALKDAFGARSYALRDMVSLYIANYFSDAMPTASRNNMQNARAERNKRRLTDMRRSGHVT